MEYCLVSMWREQITNSKKLKVLPGQLLLWSWQPGVVGTSGKGFPDVKLYYFLLCLFLLIY